MTCSVVRPDSTLYGVPQPFIYVDRMFQWPAKHFRSTNEVVSELFPFSRPFFPYYFPSFFPFAFLCYVLCSFLCCFSSFYFISVPILFHFLPSSLYFSNSSFCKYFIYVPVRSFCISQRSISSWIIPDGIARYNI
jgi:hypothetical protein